MRALLAIAAAALFVWPVIQALRTGEVRSGGATIRRQKHPFRFWLALTLGTMAAILFLAVGFGLQPPSH